MGLLAINSHKLFQSEKDFILSPALKDSFTGMEFWTECFFFLTLYLFKDAILLSSSLLGLWREVHCYFYSCSFVCNVSFLSYGCQDFLFVFCQFDCDLPNGVCVCVAFVIQLDVLRSVTLKIFFFLRLHSCDIQLKYIVE